jgi:hypothetical protein
MIVRLGKTGGESDRKEGKRGNFFVLHCDDLNFSRQLSYSLASISAMAVFAPCQRRLNRGQSKD